MGHNWKGEKGQLTWIHCFQASFEPNISNSVSVGKCYWLFQNDAFKNFPVMTITYLIHEMLKFGLASSLLPTNNSSLNAMERKLWLM